MTHLNLFHPIPLRLPASRRCANGLHLRAQRDVDSEVVPAAPFRRWLLVGVALLALLPIPSWYNPYVGWLPYWMVLAPALCLLLRDRHRIAAALFAFLVRERRRRRPSVRLRAVTAARTARRARAASCQLPRLIQR